MYSAVIGWNVLYIPIKSNYSNVSVKVIVSLLIFSLGDLSIHGLKSATIIVLLSVSPFMSVYVCFIYLDAPILGAHICLQMLYTLLVLIPLSLYNALLCLSLCLCFKVYFF